MIITHWNESPAFMVSMSWLSCVHLFSMRAASNCVPQKGGLAGARYPGSPGCTALAVLKVILAVRAVEVDKSRRQSPQVMWLYPLATRIELTLLTPFK